jgi:hypothetical protein
LLLLKVLLQVGVGLYVIAAAAVVVVVLLLLAAVLRLVVPGAEVQQPPTSPVDSRARALSAWAAQERAGALASALGLWDAMVLVWVLLT